MAKIDFSKKYVQFHSELNTRFTNELILMKQYCIGLKDLDEVFEIYPDYAKSRVIFSRKHNVAVGAIHEVTETAKHLAIKYKIKLAFL